MAINLKGSDTSTYSNEISSGTFNQSSTTVQGYLLSPAGVLNCQRAASSTSPIFLGYQGTTNTAEIKADGTATYGDFDNHAGVRINFANQSGNVACDRTVGTQGVFYGKLNGNTTTTILANGDATFKGSLGLTGKAGTATAFYILNPSDSNATTVGFNADGSGTFAKGQLTIQNNGILKCRGRLGRQGTSGSDGTSAYNFNWSGTSMEMWVDTVNLGNVNYTSDYRIKREIQTIDTDATSRVKALRPVSYKRADYGELFKASEETLEGFIAHEVQEVIPSGATGTKDCENEVQSLRLDAILAVTTKALQEALTRIEALEAQLTQLTGGAN